MEDEADHPVAWQIPSQSEAMWLMPGNGRQADSAEACAPDVASARGIILPCAHLR